MVTFAPSLVGSRALVAQFMGYPATVVPRRDWNRCLLPSNSGEIHLTVAVEGSRPALKRLPFNELKISEHGDWRRMHLGTWNAIYGRAPYFDEIYPVLERVYNSDISSLSEFCGRIWGIAEGILALPEVLKSVETASPELRLEYRQLLEKSASPEVSIFHWLMLYGPKTIFALI